MAAGSTAADDAGRTGEQIGGRSERGRRTVPLESLILLLNKVFRPPNVEGRESGQAYSRWEHRWGLETAARYLEPAGDLSGKTVLDIGCGLGGKTVAYEERGASAVFGADILEANAAASRSYAHETGSGGRSAFLAGDAAELPFVNEAFDTVVANDAMEHFARPERALIEMCRVTKKGGAVWIFFTPHFSPLGSHLYDYIYTPWCHLLFTRSQIERAIRRIVRERDGGAGGGDIEGKTAEIMRSYDEDLNHMSVRRFLKIVRRIPTLAIDYLELRPAKFRFLAPATRVPVARELVTGFVVCRLERAGL
jgi:ubiquinone/menaquinone biosynthesis C-methylase UbiE